MSGQPILASPDAAQRLDDATARKLGLEFPWQQRPKAAEVCPAETYSVKLSQLQMSHDSRCILILETIAGAMLQVGQSSFCASGCSCCANIQPCCTKQFLTRAEAQSQLTEVFASLKTANRIDDPRNNARIHLQCAVATVYICSRPPGCAHMHSCMQNQHCTNVQSCALL